MILEMVTKERGFFSFESLSDWDLREFKIIKFDLFDLFSIKNSLS